MAQPKQFTTRELIKDASLWNKLPFQVTRNGDVIADVVAPGAVWYECEECGVATQNVLQYEDKETQKWDTLYLCDKCQAKLL